MCLRAYVLAFVVCSTACAIGDLNGEHGETGPQDISRETADLRLHADASLIEAGETSLDEPAFGALRKKVEAAMAGTRTTKTCYYCICAARSLPDTACRPSQGNPLGESPSK